MTLDLAKLFGDCSDDVEQVDVCIGSVIASAIETPTALVRQSIICRCCDYNEASLHIIHDGESIRRDCVRCGSFVDFPVWHNAMATENYVDTTEDVASRNEVR